MCASLRSIPLICFCCTVSAVAVIATFRDCSPRSWLIPSSLTRSSENRTAAAPTRIWTTESTPQSALTTSHLLFTMSHKVHGCDPRRAPLRASSGGSNVGHEPVVIQTCVLVRTGSAQLLMKEFTDKRRRTNCVRDGTRSQERRDRSTSHN